MQQNFIILLCFFFPYHPKSNVAASPHKSKNKLQIPVSIKRHSVPFKTMGDDGFFLYLARLAARVCAIISRQGIEQLRSWNYLL